MKKLGVPATPLASALATSSATRGRACAGRARPRTIGVEPELLGVVGRCRRRQLVLMVEKLVVHRPEVARAAAASVASAASCAFGWTSLSGQVTPYVAKVVAERAEELANHDLGLAAVRALVVAVLDQRHRRVLGASNVVALGVDLVGEVEQLLGGTGDLTRPEAAGSSPDHPEHAEPHGRSHAAAASTPSLASSSCWPSKARLEISSETVNPIPATVAAPDDHRPAQRAAQTREPGPRREPRRADDPERLADHVRRTTIPSVIGDENAPPSSWPFTWMPALASANSGTITKLVQGWSRCWRRSLGEIADATLRSRRAGALRGRLLAEGSCQLRRPARARRAAAGMRPWPARPPALRSRDRCATCTAPPRRRRPTDGGGLGAPGGGRVAKREQRKRTERPRPPAGRPRVLRVDGRDHDQRYQVVEQRQREQPHPQTSAAWRHQRPARPARTRCRWTSRLPIRARPTPPALNAR